MTLETILILAASVGVTVYLLYALLRPEKL